MPHSKLLELITSIFLALAISREEKSLIAILVKKDRPHLGPSLPSENLQMNLIESESKIKVTEVK